MIGKSKNVVCYQRCTSPHYVELRAIRCPIDGYRFNYRNKIIEFLQDLEDWRYENFIARNIDPELMSQILLVSQNVRGNVLRLSEENPEINASLNFRDLLLAQHYPEFVKSKELKFEEHVYVKSLTRPCWLLLHEDQALPGAEALLEYHGLSTVTFLTLIERVKKENIESISEFEIRRFKVNGNNPPLGFGVDFEDRFTFD